MEITKIYQRYRIPKNLQHHMLRVAAVGEYICQNWQGKIDQVAVVQTLLLHDLGNLLKFELDKGVELFDESERDVTHWKQVKQELAQKYSAEEHQATLLMAEEIGASQRVLSLLQSMGSSNLGTVAASDDWELKIITYSDMRVDPHGYVSVAERFDDILVRYKGRSHSLADEQRTLANRDHCLELEKQLQTKVSVSLADLPLEDLHKNTQELKAYRI